MGSVYLIEIPHASTSKIYSKIRAGAFEAGSRRSSFYFDHGRLEK